MLFSILFFIFYFFRFIVSFILEYNLLPMIFYIKYKANKKKEARREEAVVTFFLLLLLSKYLWAINVKRFNQSIKVHKTYNNKKKYCDDERKRKPRTYENISIRNSFILHMALVYWKVSDERVHNDFHIVVGSLFSMLNFSFVVAANFFFLLL